MKITDLISLAAVMVLAGSCNAGAKREPELRSVRLAVPEEISGISAHSFAGQVKEADRIALGFKTAGEISSINVKEGQKVSKGQLLAVLDDIDYQLGVNALQSQYDQLKAEVERMSRLYERKSISANDYEKALSGLEQLEAQLEMNKNKLAYTRLYAPMSGIVESIDFSAKEMVNAGTPVISFLDVSSMIVETNIPASAYEKRESFTSIECRTRDGRTFPLKIKSIAPSPDANQLYLMKLAFTGKEGNGLNPGSNVDVIIGSEEGGKAGFSVPLSAIFLDGESSCVWVCGEDNILSKREISFSEKDGQGRAIVTSGLDGSEKIVRAGAKTLQEGEKVKVLPEPSKTNVGGLL